MIRTGIFGGSFNPIHNGHIILARQLKERAGLDEVWLMVSPHNPLKQHAGLLADEARMEMARKAVEGEAGIVASDYEMQLPRPSYTWNTLQALSREYPDREFVLMIGGDNWKLFDRWYHTRTPGDPGFIDISSTEIRRRIREGLSFEDLVPKSVADIIKEKGYYA